MTQLSAQRTLFGTAFLAMALMPASGALWASRNVGGFLAVATLIVACALASFLAWKRLRSALVEAVEFAERSRQDLAQARQEVCDIVNLLDTAVNRIAKGNRGLSDRTDRQAGAIEQTAAGIEELTASVNHTTRTAHETQSVASLASESTGKGIHASTMVISHMESIREGTARVAEIVGMIDTIAFQTNILALNAAVEAARAGDQGRGFAVVASEVRTLSMQCSASARQIRDLVRSASSQVGESADTVDHMAEAMAEINGRVAEVNEHMNAIVAASGEQTSGIDQVGRTIAQMERDTGHNARLVDENMAATEALAALIARLARLGEGSRPNSAAPGSLPTHASTPGRTLISRPQGFSAK